MSNSRLIGITGAGGFLGWHLRCALTALGRPYLGADRELLADPARARDFVTRCAAIVHLAGVNRGSDHDVVEGNLAAARQLIAALQSTERAPVIVYVSSAHALQDGSAYGRAKSKVGEMLENWAEGSRTGMSTLVVPHVFGEHGRPFYNSVTATFCHQLRHGEEARVVEDKPLELIHAQDLCDVILGALDDLLGPGRTTAERVLVGGRGVLVSELLERLRRLAAQLDSLEVPCSLDPFERALLNTLRSYSPTPPQATAAAPHVDERGRLHEVVRAGSPGQAFVSWTHPEARRGGHFHRRKFERFIVLAGIGRVRLRRVCAPERHEVVLDAREAPAWLDMHTLHSHDITNIGACELVTLFWADEHYNADRPDTYPYALDAQGDGA